MIVISAPGAIEAQFLREILGPLGQPLVTYGQGDDPSPALAVVWIFLVLRIGRLHDERTVERAERAARGLRETAL